MHASINCFYWDKKKKKAPKNNQKPVQVSMIEGKCIILSQTITNSLEMDDIP